MALSTQAKHNGVLTAEQRRLYHQNGYIIVKNCLSQFDIDRYVDRMKTICESRADFPLLSVMRDVALAKTDKNRGIDGVTKIMDWQDDDVLFEYCKHPQILPVVKELIGHANSNIVSMNTMLFNKPPDPGTGTSRHPLHQDLHYFPFRPAEGICCSWTALVPVNRQNGCLVVLPGTHKGAMRKHGYPKWEGPINFAYYGIQDFDASAPRTYVEMGPGDTVFFHPLLIHGSGTNRSDGFRRAISCHYANDDVCRYDPHHAVDNEETVREMRALVKERFANEEDQFTYLWKLRARPVNGTKSNL